MTTELQKMELQKAAEYQADIWTQIMKAKLKYPNAQIKTTQKKTKMIYLQAYKRKKRIGVKAKEKLRNRHEGGKNDGKCIG